MKKAYKNRKMLIAGVGGQGIVYLTNIMVEAAMISDIPVSVSEIHGLSQRGGMVTAGIGLGEYVTGFTGEARVDFLFGLEPLETQRCLPLLHRNSSIIFGDYRIIPFSVNVQSAAYPEVDSFAGYLREQCREVVFVKNFPEDTEAVLYNIFLLGRATRMKDFPFDTSITKEAMINMVPDYHREKALEAFIKGVKFVSEIPAA